MADLCQERVPKGGGYHTESSVLKSLNVGVGGCEQTRVQALQFLGRGIGSASASQNPGS